jgi:hypothetical protein
MSGSVLRERIRRHRIYGRKIEGKKIILDADLIES